MVWFDGLADSWFLLSVVIGSVLTAMSFVVLSTDGLGRSVVDGLGRSVVGGLGRSVLVGFFGQIWHCLVLYC